MQRVAEDAVIAAKEKFGINLDFTENSLQNLEIILQQAHEQYRQAASNVCSPNIPIENTVMVWGSFFGEVIRHCKEGDWFQGRKDVFIQFGSRRLDPLEHVRLRITKGPMFSIQILFSGIEAET
jgi:hypothetical protein